MAVDMTDHPASLHAVDDQPIADILNLEKHLDDFNMQVLVWRKDAA